MSGPSNLDSYRYTYTYVYSTLLRMHKVQTAEAVDYNCISSEGKDPPLHSNESLGYDTKQSDGVALVMKLWAMWSTSLFPLLPSLLWPGVVALDRVLTRGSNWTVWHFTSVQTNDLRWIELWQRELFDHLTVWLMTNWIFSDTQQYLEPFNFDLCWIELLEIELFDHLTVCKKMSDVLLNF